MSVSIDTLREMYSYQQLGLLDQCKMEIQNPQRTHLSTEVDHGKDSFTTSKDLLKKSKLKKKALKVI
jgi:hypothetical protein